MGKYDCWAMVSCPYYKGEHDTELMCEGLLEGSIAISRYRSQKRKKAWRAKCCCKDWQHCPIADALNKKWGYDND